MTRGEGEALHVNADLTLQPLNSTDSNAIEVQIRTEGDSSIVVSCSKFPDVGDRSLRRVRGFTLTSLDRLRQPLRVEVAGDEIFATRPGPSLVGRLLRLPNQTVRVRLGRAMRLWFGR